MKKKITLDAEILEFSYLRKKTKFLVFSIQEMKDLYPFRDKSEWALSEFVYKWLHSKFCPEIEKFIHENGVKVGEDLAEKGRGGLANVGMFLSMNPNVIDMRSLDSCEDDSSLFSSIIEIECDLEKEYKEFVEKKNEEKIPDEELIKLYWDDLKKGYEEIDKELAQKFLPGTLVIPKGSIDYREIKLVAYWSSRTSQGIEFGTPESAWHSFKGYRPIGRIF